MSVLNIDRFDTRLLTEFGITALKFSELFDLPEMKEQHFTAYAEGYQVARHDAPKAHFEGLIQGASIADFSAKVADFHSLMSAAGEREMKSGNVVIGRIFLPNGISIRDVMMVGNEITAKINFRAIYSLEINYIKVPEGDFVLTPEGEKLEYY